MNPVADVMRAILDGDEEVLMHYGVARRSGRYEWGSGEDPYQHNSMDFLGRVETLKKNGWKETPENIRKEFGENMTTTLYRNELSYSKYERRLKDIQRIKSLQADGLNNTEIGKIMGKNESSIRSLLDKDAEIRMNKARNTATFLKDRLDEVKPNGMLDVGAGVDKELNVTPEKLNQALFILEKEGYKVYSGGIPQVTNPGQQTTQKVLCQPGTPHKDIYNYENVHSVKEYTSHDGGETFDKFVYPKSMSSKRLQIRYAEDVGPDGAKGVDKDGIIELRRGVDDLSLGNARYSQVRILVDDKSYMKGMAVYSDNMPDGVDVIFNTNKKQGTPMNKVLKDIKEDPDNPFGSLIKANGQSYYIDKNGKKQLSLINKRADEGDWDEWADALPSQFLGKQSLNMAKKQLNLAKADKAAEFDEICSLNNPTIKKHLLDKFADECDSAAVHLKAAALPGQKYHVIIPVNSLKDTEVYAPNYENGSKVALIRYPHGGTFEIPILTVNNRHKPAKDLIGTDVIDAVGINKKNADRLSGADFDGDTVMVIPTHDKAGKVRITSSDKLKDLDGFEPKDQYGYTSVKEDSDGTKHYYRNGNEFRVMKNTGTEMGVISNLITDMTLGGAKESELARAVKHSMVVIDAEKHKLDYKASEYENDIASLKKKYQYHDDGTSGGASTILSRSKGETSVLKRQGSPKINVKGDPDYDPTRPEGALIYKTAEDLYKPKYTTNKKTGERTYTTTTGEKIKYDPADKDAADQYRPIKTKDDKTGEITYKNKKGDTYVLEPRTQESTRMAETDDAHTLVSSGRHPMEIVYADYANSMKAMANQARLESYATPRLKYNSTAKATYQTEVASLNDKLKDALLNAPREREAQRRANVIVSNKQTDNPDMKKSDVKKARQQAITSTRNEVGAIARRKRNIDITDREWEAIQAGAISDSTLKKILNNTDTDALRQRATPRATNSLSTAQVNRIKRLADSNYTLAEIARITGKSTTTVSKCLKGVN